MWKMGLAGLHIGITLFVKLGVGLKWSLYVRKSVIFWKHIYSLADFDIQPREFQVDVKF